MQARVPGVLDADPTIREAAHIVVSVERRGIMGLCRVHDGGGRTRVERIAAMHGGGRQVVDAIRVQA